MRKKFKRSTALLLAMIMVFSLIGDPGIVALAEEAVTSGKVIVDEDENISAYTTEEIETTVEGVTATETSEDGSNTANTVDTTDNSASEDSAADTDTTIEENLDETKDAIESIVSSEGTKDVSESTDETEKTGDTTLSGTLITNSQLEALGCEINDDDGDCSASKYSSWLLKTHWHTRTSHVDDSTYVWRVNADGMMYYGSINHSSNLRAVRPVITISKSALANL